MATEDRDVFNQKLAGKQAAKQNIDSGERQRAAPTDGLKIRVLRYVLYMSYGLVCCKIS